MTAKTGHGANAPLIEFCEREAACFQLADDLGCDEISGNHEETVDTEEAALGVAEADVKEKHR